MKEYSDQTGGFWRETGTGKDDIQLVAEIIKGRKVNLSPDRYGLPCPIELVEKIWGPLEVHSIWQDSVME